MSVLSYGSTAASVLLWRLRNQYIGLLAIVIDFCGLIANWDTELYIKFTGSFSMCCSKSRDDKGLNA
jgi:hypothetical protein